ncbi:MAG: LLM class flavin-dependent oxidoreductase [Chloroflexi bacterium]|nr:LLM class flavin-dependent oxidoreductase [Chloroflexota bacterium]
MQKRPRFGILLPTRRLIMTGDDDPSFGEIVSMAKAAEDAGLDSVWAGDSLTAKPRLEPLTALAAVAAHTKRVRLGTAVLLAALRHPVLLAHAAGTLDLISGGRTVLAVGVGGAFNDAQRREWRNAGVDPTRRASRMEEVVEIAKRLTSGEAVTHKGKHFELDSVSVLPKSPQPGGVPMLVACHWRAGRDAQFQRAARLGDGYISISDYPEEYAKVTERVKAHAAALGKDFDKIEAAFYMTVNLNSDAKKAFDEADRFLHLYYGMNMWGDRWGPYGPPSLAVERIRRYVEAGAGTIIVRFASFEQERQLDIFLNEVVPAF